MRAERPNDPQLPPPKLTAIDFVTGEVRLLIMKDDKFVGTVQAGKPSMFADNSASFAVELKDLGAELLYQAMKKGGGVAVVEYDLGFETRLPAVHVYAHCDSKEVKDVVMTYTDVYKRQRRASRPRWPAGSPGRAPSSRHRVGRTGRP